MRSSYYNTVTDATQGWPVVEVSCGGIVKGNTSTGGSGKFVICVMTSPFCQRVVSVSLFHLPDGCCNYSTAIPGKDWEKQAWSHWEKPQIAVSNLVQFPINDQRWPTPKVLAACLMFVAVEEMPMAITKRNRQSVCPPTSQLCGARSLSLYSRLLRL